MWQHNGGRRKLQRPLLSKAAATRHSPPQSLPWLLEDVERSLNSARPFLSSLTHSHILLQWPKVTPKAFSSSVTYWDTFASSDLQSLFFIVGAARRRKFVFMADLACMRLSEYFINLFPFSILYQTCPDRKIALTLLQHMCNKKIFFHISRLRIWIEWFSRMSRIYWDAVAILLNFLGFLQNSDFWRHESIFKDLLRNFGSYFINKLKYIWLSWCSIFWLFDLVISWYIYGTFQMSFKRMEGKLSAFFCFDVRPSDVSL